MGWFRQRAEGRKSSKFLRCKRYRIGFSFWLISIVSFLTVITSTTFVPGSFLNRSIAILTCAIFSASSTACITNFSGLAIGVEPNTPAFTSNVKQLDADHAEIRLTFPKGCEFLSHLTKTPEGIIQDSLHYSHNNLKACGVKPFTLHYSNAGKTVEIQIQGENDRLRLDASANEGTIQQTYQDANGKVQQQATPIPKEILDYLKALEKKPLVKGGSAALPNSRDSQPEQIIKQSWLVASSNPKNLYSPNSVSWIWKDSDLDTPCGRANFGQHICDWMSITTGITGFAGLIGQAIPFIPYLNLGSIVSQTFCAYLYGGFPPILGGLQRIEQEIAVSRSLNELNNLSKNQRPLGELLKDNPDLQAYVNNILNAAKAPPNITAGNAVTGLAQAFDAYLGESKNNSLLSELIQGKLHDFLHDCRNPTNAFLTQGDSTNDPHLTTFDGLKYDLQAVGEFILARSSHDEFNLQVRQTPFNNSASVSINSAVAVKVGSDRVAFYAQHFPDDDTSNPLRVNSKSITIPGDQLALKGGGKIWKQGSTYVINSPTGEKVLVSPSGAGNNAFFNISSFVYNRSGEYSGLLGNVNGKPNDDLQIRGGGNVLKVQSTYGDVNKVLNQVGLRLPGALKRGEKVYFDQLYKQFANSWRVKQEESLFDYPAGKTTKNYLDPSFPEQYLKLDMLSPSQIEKARNACTESKVSQDLMEGCIFDVGFSGFDEFARTTAQINGYVNIVKQLFPSINLPSVIVDPIIPKKICAFGICVDRPF